MSRTFHHIHPKYRNAVAAQTRYAYWVHYGHGHNGGKGIRYRANRFERTARADLRTYARTVVGTHRAGGDVDSLRTPDARPRHRAIWEYW
ncbi:hypothetical protein [Nocardia sp. NPDC004722]